MNVSIIGPEGSGKTTFAIQMAKRAAHGRPIYVLGEIKTEFPSITLDQFGNLKDCVIIIDDANALLDQYEIQKKNSPIRRPMFLHRHWNRLNIAIFHSLDDSVKVIFRQSRYIFVSKMYRDSSFKRNKFLQGITPTVDGRKPYQFLSYKRY